MTLEAKTRYSNAPHYSTGLFAFAFFGTGNFARGQR
jgi:hypothetical protein